MVRPWLMETSFPKKSGRPRDRLLTGLDPNKPYVLGPTLLERSLNKEACKSGSGRLIYMAAIFQYGCSIFETIKMLFQRLSAFIENIGLGNLRPLQKPIGVDRGPSTCSWSLHARKTLPLTPGG